MSPHTAAGRGAGGTTLQNRPARTRPVAQAAFEIAGTNERNRGHHRGNRVCTPSGAASIARNTLWWSAMAKCSPPTRPLLSQNSSMSTPIRHLGQAGGEPNGIALDRDGHFLIANWGLGVLQDLDPETGEITELISGQLDGRPLRWLNFVCVDSDWRPVVFGEHDGGRSCRYHRPRHRRWVHLSRRTGSSIGASGRRRGELPELHGAGSRRGLSVCGPHGGRRRGAVSHRGRNTRRRQSDSARRWAAGAPTSSAPTHGRFLADPQVGRRWGMADGCAFDADGKPLGHTGFGQQDRGDPPGRHRRR